MIRKPNFLCTALIAGSFPTNREADLVQGGSLGRGRDLLARTGKKEEALGLKRLLHPLIVTSAAAMVVLAANNAVGASNEQTLAPTRNNAGNEPILLAQNAAPQGAKSSNVNVDGKGVILKGYDAVAYFKQRKPLKGNPAFESTHQGVT